MNFYLIDTDFCIIFFIERTVNISHLIEIDYIMVVFYLEIILLSFLIESTEYIKYLF